MLNITLHNPKTLKVTFQYNPDMVLKVKSLMGHRWFPAGKYWTVSNTDFNKLQLKSWGGQFDPIIDQYQVATSAPKLKENQIKTTADLREYQVAGLQFFHAHNGNVLLADEQGLGKTVQTISYINSVKKFPCLIVAPSSVKFNWAKEIKKWTKDRSIYVCSGRTASITPQNLKNFHWIICNYDILTGQTEKSWFNIFNNIPFKMMVLDESQNIKNYDAKRTKTIIKLAKLIPSRTCLSGTPISNRPMEFWTTFKVIEPDMFPNRNAFGRRYCGPVFNGFGTTYNGATNIEELNQILKSSFMLRRLKTDVLKDLPEKQKMVVPVEMTPEYQKKYLDATLDFISFLRSIGGNVSKAERAETIVKLNTLRKLTMQGKIDACTNWISEFLETTGKKLVVFAWHQEAISALMNKFGDIAVKIDGTVNAANRQIAVDRFQNDNSVRLFVGNIKAAGAGITLTAASDTCTIELSWSPSDLAQSEDRVHRIGQKNAVSNYYLLADNTIDTQMMSLIDEKKKVIDMIMDGKESENETLLTALMKQFLEKGHEFERRKREGKSFAESLSIFNSSEE